MRGEGKVGKDEEWEGMKEGKGNVQKLDIIY
jgi:hypothetical protein